MRKGLFNGTRGSRSAKYMFVGEAWSSEDNNAKQPFVGQSGKSLMSILAESMISESDCFFTNVVNERPPSNFMRLFFNDTNEARAKGLPFVKGLYPKDNVLLGMDLLEEQIDVVQPEYIIPLGNYPLWALTDDCYSISSKKIGDDSVKYPTGIINWRGSQLRHTRTNTKLMPTFHPAAWLRQLPWKFDAQFDIRVRLRSDPWDDPERNFIIHPSFQETVKILQKLLTTADRTSAKLELAVDLETLSGFTTCTGLAWTTKHAICIPWVWNFPLVSYWKIHEEVAIKNLLRKLLSHPNVFIVGQNFIYDTQYIANELQIIPTIGADTMIMHHGLYPAKRMSLDYISSYFCQYHRYWKDDVKTWTTKNYTQERGWIYNCRDCVVTLEAFQNLRLTYEYKNKQHIMHEGNRQANSIARMTLRGIAMDHEQRRKAEEDLQIEIAETERRLDFIVGKHIIPKSKKASAWYRSPKQTATVLYDILGLPKQKSPKTGNVTTDDAALDALRNKDALFEPLIVLLQEYRSLCAFTKFTEMELDPDGRLRSSFSPTASTFRWRSSENAFGFGGNLQNIPEGTEDV